MMFFADEENTGAQLVIPQALREEILTDLHDGVLGGHLGVEKTWTKVKQLFYWPVHYNDVQE